MLKITQKKTTSTVKEENEAATLLPLELTHVPGIVEDQTAYTESISRYPNRRTAFVGALAMLAFAAGRRYRTDDNTRTNEYLICYANSGAGKDAPRKVNKEIAVECGCASCVGDVIGSGEGLQDALLTRAKFLIQNDEFDTLIRAIAEDKSGAKESLVRELLSEYSSAGSMITKRALSQSMAKASAATKDHCIHPHLCLFGSSVGQYLFETLNDRVLENGLCARCLLVDCGKRQGRQQARWRSVPDGIVNAYRSIMGSTCEAGKYKIPDVPDVKIEPTVIGYSRDAYDLNEEILDRYDREYNSLNDGQHAAEQSFKARSGEHLAKMAMVYAISTNHEDPMITTDALTWADKFVTHCQNSMITNIERYTAASPHEANVKRIMRSLEKRKTITKREITKCLRLPVAVADEVITYMVTVGSLVETDTGVYHAAK